MERSGKFTIVQTIKLLNITDVLQQVFAKVSSVYFCFVVRTGPSYRQFRHYLGAK